MILVNSSTGPLFFPCNPHLCTACIQGPHREREKERERACSCQVRQSDIQVPFLGDIRSHSFAGHQRMSGLCGFQQPGWHALYRAGRRRLQPHNRELCIPSSHRLKLIGRSSRKRRVDFCTGLYQTTYECFCNQITIPLILLIGF